MSAFNCRPRLVQRTKASDTTPSQGLKSFEPEKAPEQTREEGKRRKRQSQDMPEPSAFPSKSPYHLPLFSSDLSQMDHFPSPSPKGMDCCLSNVHTRRSPQSELLLLRGAHKARWKTNVRERFDVKRTRTRRRYQGLVRVRSRSSSSS